MGSRHLLASFESASDYFDYRDRKALVDAVRVSEKPPTPGFRLSLYPSGELSGAFYIAGGGYKKSPPRRLIYETESLSSAAKAKIRRAIENSEVEMKVFVTLTFAPKLLEPWHFYEDGTVRHDFAKWKLKKFRQALTMACNRRIKKRIEALKARESDPRRLLDGIEEIQKDGAFRFLWVAEVQPNTGNIHFHLVLNQYFPIDYLSRLWGQANNSVDVEWLNNPEHVVNYLRKYISKDEVSNIKGCRYNMSCKMRDDMQPRVFYRSDKEAVVLRELVGHIKDVINSHGGKVVDSGFGFVIPYPRPSKSYICRKTRKRRQTREIRSDFVELVIDTLLGGAVPF